MKEGEVWAPALDCFGQPNMAQGFRTWAPMSNVGMISENQLNHSGCHNQQPDVSAITFRA